MYPRSMSRAVERCANLVSFVRLVSFVALLGGRRGGSTPRDMWRLSGDGQGIPDASFLIKQDSRERLMATCGPKGVVLGVSAG